MSVSQSLAQSPVVVLQHVQREIKKTATVSFIFNIASLAIAVVAAVVATYSIHVTKLGCKEMTTTNKSLESLERKTDAILESLQQKLETED